MYRLIVFFFFFNFDYYGMLKCIRRLYEILHLQHFLPENLKKFQFVLEHFLTRKVDHGKTIIQNTINHPLLQL